MSFTKDGSLRRHVITQHNPQRQRLPCPTCGELFGRQDNLASHIRLQHQPQPAPAPPRPPRRPKLRLMPNFLPTFEDDVIDDDSNLLLGAASDTDSDSDSDDDIEEVITEIRGLGRTYNAVRQGHHADYVLDDTGQGWVYTREGIQYQRNATGQDCEGRERVCYVFRTRNADAQGQAPVFFRSKMLRMAVAEHILHLMLRGRRRAVKKLIRLLRRGLVVRHRCGNSECVRVGHLIFGAAADNIVDSYFHNLLRVTHTLNQRTFDKVRRRLWRLPRWSYLWVCV